MSLGTIFLSEFSPEKVKVGLDCTTKVEVNYLYLTFPMVGEAEYQKFHSYSTLPLNLVVHGRLKKNPSVNLKLIVFNQSYSPFF